MVFMNHSKVSHHGQGLGRARVIGNRFRRRAAEQTVEVLATRKKQPARQVRQQIAVKRCSIRPPKGGAVEVTALQAREIDAPEGVTPIQWRLLSNRMADMPEAVTELINWYRCRWEVEMFFDILKNGCKVEALQLSMIERLKLALALFMVIAWRIQMLMRLGRTCPDIDCEVVFEPEEWRAAYIVARKPIPPQPPPLNTVIRLVASFGGFLGRKGDGEPAPRPCGRDCSVSWTLPPVSGHIKRVIFVCNGALLNGFESSPHPFFFTVRRRITNQPW